MVVKINNQTLGVPRADMLAWSEGTDNGRQKPKPRL